MKKYITIEYFHNKDWYPFYTDFKKVKAVRMTEIMTKAEAKKRYKDINLDKL